MKADCFVEQIASSFTALCYSSSYFPISADELKVWDIHRKELTSTLQKRWINIE